MTPTEAIASIRASIAAGLSPSLSDIEVLIAECGRLGTQPPNWKDAPDWANYCAMNPSGAWIWFEERPFASESSWESRINNRSRWATEPVFNGWEKSLHVRPRSPHHPTSEE